MALKILGELRKRTGLVSQRTSDVGGDLRTQCGRDEVRKRLRGQLDVLRRSLRSPPFWLFAVYFVQEVVLPFSLAKELKRI